MTAKAEESWATALEQLEHSPTPSERTNAIDAMTELLQLSDWQLPQGFETDVIVALRDRLSDSNWCRFAYHHHQTSMRYMFTSISFPISLSVLFAISMPQVREPALFIAYW